MTQFCKFKSLLSSDFKTKSIYHTLVPAFFISKILSFRNFYTWYQKTFESFFPLFIFFHNTLHISKPFDQHFKNQDTWILYIIYQKPFYLIKIGVNILSHFGEVNFVVVYLSRCRHFLFDQTLLLFRTIYFEIFSLKFGIYLVKCGSNL